MKKLILLSGLFLTVMAFSTSCKKNNSPFIGNWSKVLVVGDTANFNAIDNSNFQYNNTTTQGTTDAGSGTYSYTGTQLTFTFTADASGNNCIGTPGVYTYAITGNIMNLVNVNDVCTNSSSVPRYYAVNGTWTRK